MAVLLETTLGDVVIDLYTEERPRACLNFLKLCKIKYYNYCLIHNVQRDFIIQTGDPSGSGRGGESIFSKLYGDQARYFEPEKVPRIKHKKLGTVSLVNNGSDQHGSQFLITTGVDLDYLDGVHTVFGEVTEGMEVLKKINETFVDKDFVPFQDIRINHTVILADPFDDPPELPIPDRSPEPTKEQLDSGRIGADEEIDDNKGKSNEEIEEQLAEKEAKTRAVLLEMDFISVSFVFPLPSCEIIRDWKTGESLCYAFIEFEKEEDCEKAYFKMDNVLIDDRRIHVDFSQSVAKIKWKGKGGKYTKDDFKEYEKDAGKSSKLTLKDNAKPKQDSKYELVLDDNVEDNSSDQRHTSKHKKEKKRHYSDDEDVDDRRMKKSKEAHRRRHEDDYCREKRKGEKKGHRRSRSQSRERNYCHSSKEKSREETRERDRRRERSPKQYKDKSKYRERD
ncbi:hypothetical protein GDO78_016981 [Eleutherodactylus coqui]|uniref:Peptidyl-prolyl cis-trans isomerase n=1 Tax=Eleutherodactylus coqui TaxID=57060 RepID=A0A8J6BN70_ELECQ|nr:hypothetical protein GDO78_016981 [Eleutherodactylus coqui]